MSELADNSELFGDGLADDGGNVDGYQRPDGLPDNFRTIEALAESHLQATRKISAQGSELSQLRAENAELAARLAASSWPAEPVTPLWDELAEAADPADPYALDPVERMRALAHAAAFAYDHQVGAVPNAQQIAAGTNELAGQMLVEIIPDWPDWRDRAAEVVSAAPALQASLQDALERGDAAAVSQAWLTAVGAAKTVAADRMQQANSTAAKLTAQTLSGAGNRAAGLTADQEAWKRVRAAGDSYADSRQKSGL